MTYHTYRTPKKQGLAVTAPKFDRVESKSDGGFSRIAQRVDLILVDLVMDYEIDGVYLPAGRTKLALRGDAGATAWAKRPMVVGGVTFVLCPEGDVIAYSIDTSPIPGEP